MQTCAWSSFFRADKAPSRKCRCCALFAIQKDGVMRVYIATTLLLLLLTVSQVCA